MATDESRFKCCISRGAKSQDVIHIPQRSEGRGEPMRIRTEVLALTSPRLIARPRRLTLTALLQQSVAEPSSLGC